MDYNDFASLTGKKITAIFMDEEWLVFRTTANDYIFTVLGDCCSASYFYDFIGVGKLLEADHVIGVESIDLDANGDDTRYQEHMRAYGFKIISEHPKFGEVTSVFSFRNDSNGYYGGWCEKVSYEPSKMPPQITGDVLETQRTNS